MKRFSIEICDTTMSKPRKTDCQIRIDKVAKSGNKERKALFHSLLAGKMFV